MTTVRGRELPVATNAKLVEMRAPVLQYTVQMRSPISSGLTASGTSPGILSVVCPIGDGSRLTGIYIS
jgi:hypothetical protein